MQPLQQQSLTQSTKWTQNTSNNLEGHSAYLHQKQCNLSTPWYDNVDHNPLIKRTGYKQDRPAQSVKFWLFAGQCKSIAEQRKIFFGKQETAICVDDEFDLYKSNYVRELWLKLGG